MWIGPENSAEDYFARRAVRFHPTSFMQVLKAETSGPLQLWMMIVAAIASFTVFAVCRWLFSTGTKHRLFGVILSYVVLTVLYLVVGAIEGNLDESIMWLPIALMFGVPFMAPLIFMAWLGSVLAFGKGNTITG